MPRNLPQEIQSLKQRIAQRRARHESTGDLQARLTVAVTQQLRRENREDRNAGRGQ